MTERCPECRSTQIIHEGGGAYICNSCLATFAVTQFHRSPGGPILHVVNSHRWFWKPHFALRGENDTITLQWLNFHARWWRKGSPGA